MSKTPQKPQDDEERRPRKKGDSIAAWVLTGMLVLGLGGFGVTSFGTGVTSIGSVGKEVISTDDYARAIRQEANAMSAQLQSRISMSDALTFGLDQQALRSVITRAALDGEAAQVGLSIGDASVAAEVRKMDSFSGTAGGFDRDSYAFALKQEGWSEAAFENAVRKDVARSLLQGAVTGGFDAPQPVLDAMYRWVAERRSFSMIRLTEGDLTAPLPQPTDEQLQAYYQANIASFTKPEATRIDYAALLPDAIAQDQPVDEDAVRKLYDDRIAEFVTPERRLVERLVYPDQAAADAALASGVSFDALVEARGLTMDAVDMGDVSAEDLGVAGEAVFAAPEGTVFAADSALGPALYRVNGVLSGENTSYQEAREALAAEMQTDAARRLIADKVEEIDDLLAGGTSLKDLAAEQGMTFATLDHVKGQQGDAAIEGYTAFRAAADQVTASDFPEAIVLDDGGVVALQFVEIVPATPIPFDQAREDVVTAWTADQLKQALSARAIEIKAALEAGGAIGSFGIVDQTPEITRERPVEGAPATLVPAAFEMTPGDIRVIEERDFIAVLQLNAIIPAIETGEAADAMKAALKVQFQQAFSTDALASYTDLAISSRGVQLDEGAINAVNKSLQ
ncbi:MAG: SurA N-terminal domain-containing protein [Paracoccaceae bacterium]